MSAPRVPINMIWRIRQVQQLLGRACPGEYNHQKPGLEGRQLWPAHSLYRSSELMILHFRIRRGCRWEQHTVERVLHRDTNTKFLAIRLSKIAIWGTRVGVRG